MSDERDEIEKEFEQCAAEEAAQVEAEAEAERAMSDEGKVICEKAKAFVCDGLMATGAKCSWYSPFLTSGYVRHYCPKENTTIKTIPVSGEEAQDAGK